MANKQRVEVEILGQKYAMRSEATPEYVRALAVYIERRAEEVRAGAVGQDPLRLLALASLYIADELFRLRDDRAASEHDASARLGALRDQLDAASRT